MTNNHELIQSAARLEAENAALRAQIAALTEALPELIIKWNREVTRAERSERRRPTIHEVIELWRREVTK